MQKLIKKLLEPKPFLVICLLYSILISVAFLSPLNGSPRLNFFIPSDKIIHSSIYFLLAFLWNNYLYIADNKRNIIKIVLLTLSSCLVYGTIIEILQEQFVQYRGADIFDVLANMIGAILGSILFLIVKNRIKSFIY